MDRRLVENVMTLAIIITAWGVFGKEEQKEVVCKTCNDTGSIKEVCPVCRGTKYVWKCVPSQNKGWSYSTSIRYDENGNRINADCGWCGYGSTYKSLHSNCKNTRKRCVCPNCVSGKGKTSATGKVTVPCPDCDGQGVLVKTYYAIPNVRNVEYERDYIIRQLERGQSCSYVQKRKMSKDELADYKIENSNCKVFENYEALLSFLKNGEAQESDAKWYFAIRDTNNVTMYDKRRALEDIANGSFCSYSDSNIIKRKFTEEEVKDFKALNPTCKMFRSVDEFKEFVRNIKTVADGGPSVIRRTREYEQDGDRERTVITQDGVRQVTRTRGRPYEHRITPPRPLSQEEVEESLDAENAHDKEMFERKFGPAGRNAN